MLRSLPAAALCVAICTAAWAQSVPPTPAPSQPAAPQPAPPAETPPSPTMSKATQSAVDERIKTLQKQLGITEQQMPLWNAFAQAMRDNAAFTEALFQQRAGAATTMNAVDNMRSYAEIARAYADNIGRLANDFASLYASLTDVQRRAADTLFHQQMAAAAQPKRR